MKTLLILLTSISMTAQVTITGNLSGIENMAFYTDLTNKGQINGSELITAVEGHYFVIEHVSSYTKIIGNDVRVTLNGNPVIGIASGKVETLSQSNTTNWLNPNNYDQIRIGRIVKTQIFDMAGRYVGPKVLPTFQEGIYIILNHYSDGNRISEKIKI